MSTNNSKLFFHRAKGERILIGEGENTVTVEVTALNDNRVTLTMSAPRHVQIDREERRRPNLEESA